MMRLRAYILDEQGNPVQTDFLTAARWHATTDLRLLVDVVGDVRVSTVFYGMTPWGARDEEPQLWETMVFGGEYEVSLYQERYTSADAARRGHAAILARVMEHASRRQPR